MGLPGLGDRPGGGLDLARAPLQARYDGTAPIARPGATESGDGFRIRALGRSPEGRANVWLQWQVEPLGTAFDGASLGTGASRLVKGVPAAGGSAVGHEEMVGGLSLGHAYHWRARVRSRSPFFPRSPWLSLPYNAGSEADLRTPPLPVGVPSAAGIAREVRLERVWPNPFAARASVASTLPAAGHVRLEVFDPRGRRVARLVDGHESAGPHLARWVGGRAHGGEATSGVYQVRLEFAGCTQSRTLTRVK